MFGTDLNLFVGCSHPFVLVEQITENRCVSSDSASDTAENRSAGPFSGIEGESCHFFKVKTWEMQARPIFSTARLFRHSILGQCVERDRSGFVLGWKEGSHHLEVAEKFHMTFPEPRSPWWRKRISDPPQIFAVSVLVHLPAFFGGRETRGRSVRKGRSATFRLMGPNHRDGDMGAPKAPFMNDIDRSVGRGQAGGREE